LNYIIAVKAKVSVVVKIGGHGAALMKPMLRFTIMCWLILLAVWVPASAENLFSSDFSNAKALDDFRTLVPPKGKDTLKISRGNLIVAAGKNSSIDLICGDPAWSDYELVMRYRLLLPRANAGLDICVRNTQYKPQDQPGGISIHFKRHQKTGKPIRWIRQYANRDRDIMPDENAPVFADGKWHEIKVSMQGRDLRVDMDGGELFSMEDIVDIDSGNVMLSVSDGARMTIGELRVTTLP
jgi:hypothetical protein